MPDNVMKELLLDYDAYRHGQFKLSQAPSEPDARPATADDWAAVYGGMTSYESALDAAGYMFEREMKEPDAPVLVLLCRITTEGSVLYRPKGGSAEVEVSAVAIFAAHDFEPVWNVDDQSMSL